MGEVRTEFNVDGGKLPYSLVIEPWGDVLPINPGERCRLVLTHDSVVPQFALEHHPEYLVVWAEGGSGYEFWRGETRER